MMAPDPPKDDSLEKSEENNVPIAFDHTLSFSDDEDIMGEGEHELDFSNPESGDESDESGAGSQDPVPLAEGNSQVRAHYQLLIPFPTGESGDGDGLDSEVEFRPINYSHTVTRVELPQESVEIALESQEVSLSEPRREIQLTAEHSEVIKNAMKGILLPPTSIPDWAKELTEDVWQSRLSATIEKKNRSDSRPSSNK